jgi:hypothetical protein
MTTEDQTPDVSESTAADDENHNVTDQNPPKKQKSHHKKKKSKHAVDPDEDEGGETTTDGEAENKPKSAGKKKKKKKAVHGDTDHHTDGDDDDDEERPKSSKKKKSMKKSKSGKDLHEAETENPAVERAMDVLPFVTAKEIPADDPEFQDVEGQTNHHLKSKFSRNASTLAVSADPFAAREGKTLLWRNINMTLVRNVSSVMVWFGSCRKI